MCRDKAKFAFNSSSSKNGISNSSELGVRKNNRRLLLNTDLNSQRRWDRPNYLSPTPLIKFCLRQSSTTPSPTCCTIWFCRFRRFLNLALGSSVTDYCSRPALSIKQRSFPKGRESFVKLITCLDDFANPKFDMPGIFLSSVLIRRGRLNCITI